MTGSDLFVWFALGGLGLLGIGLVYFIFIGARAIYRDARRKALEAGHRRTGARLRAILRMTLWAIFFGGSFFSCSSSDGAFKPGPLRPRQWVGAMIWALLQADRLLTMSADNVRGHVHIGAAIAAVLGAFISVICFTF